MTQIFSNDKANKGDSISQRNSIDNSTKKKFPLKKLEERLAECFKNKGKILDLSRLRLKTIDINLIPKNVEMLFLSHNYIRTFPNLTDFKKLRILDLSYNKVKNLPHLPTKLVELGCNNNFITTVDLDYLKKLRRLNCSYNFIKNLKFKGEILDCSFNKLDTIVLSDKTKKLYCTKNMLEEIPYSKNMENLICSENKITKIPNGDKIHNLICDHNCLTELPKLPNLDFLHCNDNKIDRIYFFPKLKELVCDCDLKISKKFKIIEKITINHPKSVYTKIRFDINSNNIDLKN